MSSATGSTAAVVGLMAARSSATVQQKTRGMDYSLWYATLWAQPGERKPFTVSGKKQFVDEVSNDVFEFDKQTSSWNEQPCPQHGIQQLF